MRFSREEIQVSVHVLLNGVAQGLHQRTTICSGPLATSRPRKPSPGCLRSRTWPTTAMSPSLRTIAVFPSLFSLSSPRQVRRIVLTEEQMLFAREEWEDIIYEVDLCSITVLTPDPRVCPDASGHSSPLGVFRPLFSFNAPHPPARSPAGPRSWSLSQRSCQWGVQREGGRGGGLGKDKIHQMPTKDRFGETQMKEDSQVINAS